MTKYEKGKIYKIISDNTDKIYIGSSCEPTLAHRLSKHRSNYKAWLKDNTNQYITSYEILKLENYSIILIENYPCNNKDELHAKERSVIETVECVNKIIPFRTKDELKCLKQLYAIDNNEKIKQYKTK